MLKLVAVFLLPLLFISSCRKDESSICGESTVQFNGDGILSNANVTLPTVTIGMLAFESKEHYDSSLEYLGDVTVKDTLNMDSTDYVRETLADIENSLGFTNSLRNDILAQWQALNEIGWATVEEAPDLHFLHDPILQSVLNEFGDVKIGADIYVWLDTFYILQVSDEGLLGEIHNFSHSGYENVEQVFAIPGAVVIDEYDNQI